MFLHNLYIFPDPMFSKPTPAVRQELKRESLIMLSVENFSVTADYFLGYNDKRELSPAAFEFISLLTESMKPKDQI